MSIFTTVKEKLTDYLDVQLKLLKLNAIEVTSKVVGYLFFSIICLFMACTVIIFLGLGITEGFVAMGMSRVASSFLTVGVLLLVLGVLVACRKGITSMFASGIITAMSSDDDKDNKD